MYCPNCNKLTSDRNPCPHCGHDTREGSAGNHPSNEKQLSGALVLSQTIGALLLFALAVFLFWVSSKLGSNDGELAQIPALICLATAMILFLSENKLVIGIALTIELLIFAGAWEVLKIISAAAFAR